MIKVAISSVKEYSPMTLPIIVPSLLEAGIEPDDIYIFEGGHYEREETEFLDTHHILVNHNSFDYTALIDIVENEIESEYWFLLHDTCKVGPNFKELVNNIPDNKPDVVCMLGSIPGTMNICSYKYEYLLSKKELLYNLKNRDYSVDGIYQAKHRAAEAENTLQVGSVIYNPELFSDELSFEMPSVYKDNGIRRNIRYFRNLDVYKYQANYGRLPWIVDL